MSNPEHPHNENKHTEEQIYASPEAELSDDNNQSLLEDNLASRGIRLGAYILDSLIYAIGSVLPAMLLMSMTGALEDLDMQDNSSVFTMYKYAGIFILIIFGTNCYLLYKKGQSIAKKLLNIKIVRTDNSHVSFPRIIGIRLIIVNIIYQIPLLGFLFFLVDALMIFRADQRCLHDLMADTKVINS